MPKDAIDLMGLPLAVPRWKTGTQRRCASRYLACGPPPRQYPRQPPRLFRNIVERRVQGQQPAHHPRIRRLPTLGR
jgi:hypothetical protein